MAPLRDKCVPVALVVYCIAVASATDAPVDSAAATLGREDFDGLCLTQQRTLVYRAEPYLAAQARRLVEPPGDDEAIAAPQDSVTDSEAHRRVTAPVDSVADSEARRSVTPEVDDEAGSITPPEDDEARGSVTLAAADDEAGAQTSSDDDEARGSVTLSAVDDDAGAQKISEDDEVSGSGTPSEEDDKADDESLPAPEADDEEAEPRKRSYTPPGTGEEVPGAQSSHVVNHLQELVMQFQQEKQLFREDRQRWAADFEDAKAAWQQKYDQLKDEADSELRRSKLNYEDWYKANMSIVMETRVSLQQARDQIRKQDMAMDHLQHVNKALLDEKAKMNQTIDIMNAEIANLKLIKLERETYEADNRDLSERLKLCQTDKTNEERQHATDNDKRLTDIKDMMKKMNAANISAEGQMNQLRLNVQFMREKYDECSFKRSQCEDKLGHGMNQVQDVDKALHNLTVICAQEKQRLTDQADKNVQTIAKHLEEQIAKSATEKESTMQECQTQMITVNQENRRMSVDLRQVKGENDEVKQVNNKLRKMVADLEEKAEARFTAAYNGATLKITSDAKRLEMELKEQLADVNQQKQTLSRNKQDFLRNATAALVERNDALKVQNQNLTLEVENLRGQVTRMVGQLDTEHRSFAEKLQEAKLDGIAMEKTKQERAAEETIKEKTDGMYHLLMQARKGKNEAERQLVVFKSQNQMLRMKLASQQVGYRS